jgi:hypothetical protein
VSLFINNYRALYLFYGGLGFFSIDKLKVEDGSDDIDKDLDYFFF